MAKKNLATVTTVLALAAAAAFMTGGCAKKEAAPAQAETEDLSWLETEPESEPYEFMTEGEELDWEWESESEAAPVEPLDEPEYDPDEYVEVGDLTGFSIRVPEAEEVTLEDVEERIHEDVALYERYEEIDKDVVEEGDVVEIDFTGRIDGEEFDGGSAQGFYLEIGSGSFVDGFESQLVGAKVGETKDVVVTFPDDYYEELAGKEATFETKVVAIVRLMDLDDELARVMTGDDSMTAEKYEENVRAELEESAAASDRESVRGAVESALADLVTVKGYPEDVLDARVDAVIEGYQEYADYLGVSIEDAFGETMEEFEEEARNDAMNSMKVEMALLSIAKKENLLPTGDALDAALEKAAVEEYGYESLDEALLDYSRRYLEKAVAKDAALDYLTNLADVERYKTVKYDVGDAVIEYESEGDFELDLSELETETVDEELTGEFETSAEAR